MNINYLGLLLVFFTGILPLQSQNTITGKQAVEDLNFLVNTIEQTHYAPYMHISKAEW